MPKVPKPPIELIENAVGSVIRAASKAIKPKKITKAAERAISKKLANSESAQIAKATRMQQDKKLINSAKKSMSKIEVNEANSRSDAYRSMRDAGMTKRRPSSKSASESVANRDMGGLQKRYANQSAQNEKNKAAARALPPGPARRKAEQKMRDYQNKTGFR